MAADAGLPRQILPPAGYGPQPSERVMTTQQPTSSISTPRSLTLGEKIVLGTFELVFGAAIVAFGGTVFYFASAVALAEFSLVGREASWQLGGIVVGAWSLAAVVIAATALRSSKEKTPWTNHWLNFAMVFTALPFAVVAVGAFASAAFLGVLALLYTADGGVTWGSLTVAGVATVACLVVVFFATKYKRVATGMRLGLIPGMIAGIAVVAQGGDGNFMAIMGTNVLGGIAGGVLGALCIGSMPPTDGGKTGTR
jgi:hypothetical protein